MPEMTVVDSILAFTVEEGDTIQHNGKPALVKSVVDGSENMHLGLEDEFGEVDEFPFPVFSTLYIMGYAREEVFI